MCEAAAFSFGSVEETSASEVEVHWFLVSVVIRLMNEIDLCDYHQSSHVVNTRVVFSTGIKTVCFCHPFFTSALPAYSYCSIFSLCCFHAMLLQPSLPLYRQIANHIPVRQCLFYHCGIFFFFAYIPNVIMI